jgi:hypothetical protein
VQELATREDLKKILDSRKEKEDVLINEYVEKTVTRISNTIKAGKTFITRVSPNERVIKDLKRIFAAQGINIEFVESSKGNNHSLRFSLLKK